jgi:hypothetical protein
MDSMEALNGARVRPLEGATALLGDPTALQAAIERDGYLFVRGLVPPECVARLRRLILEHAQSVSWLDSTALIEQAHVRWGVRVGDYQAPDWMALQARMQTSAELWDVGDAPAERTFGRHWTAWDAARGRASGGPTLRPLGVRRLPPRFARADAATFAAGLSHAVYGKSNAAFVAAMPEAAVE